MPDQKNRIGALPPRYAFVLNPHADAGFTKCPRCDTRTNIRKFSLVIHVEDFGLLLLGKTCRLCLKCETLVVHKAELDELVRAVLNAPEPTYVVLGTANRQVHRRGLAGGASLDDVRAHTSDFKSYWKVDFMPKGWYPKSGSAG